MDIYIGIINKILSLGTIFLQIFILFLIVNLIFNRKNNKFLSFVKKYTFYLGFISALGAVILSLFYSEIIGYPPCDLCWIQRILLYPQLVIFGVELYRKNLSSLDSSLVFAVLGALTSFYHIYVENGGTIGPTCADPSSGGVSCAVRYVYEFGFVTIPLMALTLSLFIIVLIINFKINTK